MRQLARSPQAQGDVFGIVDYYQKVDVELAQTLFETIISAPLALTEQPYPGSTIRRDTRRWRICGTPFLLLYVVVPDRIDIRRVVHDRSDCRDGR